MSAFVLRLLPAFLHLASTGRNNAAARLCAQTDPLWPFPVLGALSAGTLAQVADAPLTAQTAFTLGYVIISIKVLLPFLATNEQYKSVLPFFLAIFSAGLLISPFIDITHPASALLWFWAVPVSLLFSLGGEMAFAWSGLGRISEFQHRVLLILHVITTGAMFLLSRIPHLPGLHLACAALSLTELCAYIAFCWKPVTAGVITHLRFRWVFVSALFWALTGSFLWLRYGMTAMDAVLHAWVLGWLTPLFCFVMSGALPDVPGWFTPGSRVLTAALILWEFVPFGRSLAFFLALPSWFSHVVATAATCLFMPWLIAIGVAAFRTRKQGDSLPGCG